MNRMYIPILMALPLASCSQGALGSGLDATLSPPAYSCTKPRLIPAAASAGEADRIVKDACEFAGGTFDSQLRNCRCEQQSIFTFSSPDGPSCQPMQAKTVDPGSPKFCRKTLAPNAEICFYGTDLAPQGPNILISTDGKITLPSLSLQTTQLNWVSNPDDLNNFFADDLGNMALEQIRAPAEVAFAHTGALGFPVVSILYEPNPDFISDLIQGIRPAQDFKFVAPPLNGNPGLIAALEQTANTLTTESNWDKYEPRSKLGCAELCTQTKDWMPSPGYRAHWEKTRASGAVLRNQVLLQNASGLVAAQIILTAANTPSLVFIYNYGQSPQQIKRDERVYDRLGQLIWQNSIEDTRPDLVNAGSFGNHGEVVVCENGFPIDDSPIHRRLRGRIAMGPIPSQSYFGWLNNPTLNPILAWSGLSQAIRTPGIPYYYSNDHASAVSNILATETSSEINLIPISTPDCLERPELWQSNVQQSGAKVINLSSTFSYDSATCAQSSIGKTITESPFLWILGAGNGGESVTLDISRACPANLGPLSNVIVTSATDGPQGRLISTTTSGKYFVDIAANGKNPDAPQYEGATSYAAPRVSGVGASLAKAFPQLTVPTLRFAILVGAKIDTNRSRNNFLPTRSGGRLDKVLAVRAASRLTQNPSWVTEIRNASELKSALELIQLIHCEGVGFLDRSDCNKRADERLRYLIDTGVLNNVFCQ